MAMRFRYKLQPNRTINITNAVGPTTTVGLRSIPAGFYLYCDPDGDDGTGDGSTGNPYETIDRCITDGTYNQIMLQGSHDPNEFVAPDLTIPASGVICAADGTRARITRSALKWTANLAGGTLDKEWVDIAKKEAVNPANDIWVAAAKSSYTPATASDYLYYSSDGKTFTKSTSVQAKWRSVCYNENLGKFFAPMNSLQCM